MPYYALTKEISIMNATGSLMSLADANDLREDIKQRLFNVAELIRFRLSRGDSIPQAIRGMHAEMWEVRLQFHASDSGQGALEELPELLSRSDELAPQVQYVFEVHGLVAAGLTKKREQAGVAKNVQSLPDFDFPYYIVQELGKLPNAQFRYLQAFIDSAINIDFGMLILRTHRLQRIENLDIPEFIRFFRQSAEAFAAYALLLDLWEVDDPYSSQTIRNIMIMRSAVGKDTIGRQSILPDQLKKLLLNEV